MSDMVEKVARAIDPEAFDLPRDTRGAAQKWRLRTAKARKLARAAIEAILSEDDIWLLASAAENLRGGSKDTESRVDAAFRIAFNLDKLRRRFDAALKGEAE
nr:hypothetical protein RAR13_11760 [Aminobacter aminovorans]